MADKDHIIKTYKYRLYPTQEQVAQIEQMFAAIRWIYNAALDQRRWYGRKQGTDAFYRNTNFSAYSQAKELVYNTQKDGREGLKNDPELSWITTLSTKAVENALADLDKAFERFYKGKGEVGYPSSRKYSDNNSFTIPVSSKNKSVKGFTIGVVFGKDSVKLPKIGRIKYKKHKKFSGEGRTATILREGNQYYICLTCRIQKNDYERPDTYVGIDLGVAKPVMTSDGEFLDPVEKLKEYDARYRKLQKKFSRQKKTSNRRKRTKEKLAIIKRKEARCRKNTSHQVTTNLVRKYKYIAIENLKVANMTKSAKGDMETPGCNVNAKSGLNRSILNVAPYMLRHQLEYKANWYGAYVVPVNPAYTSQTCSQCGVVNKENRKSQSEFICSDCGVTMNADHNAAINILHKAEFSGVTSNPRKTPSEIHKNPATLKSIVSANAPLIKHDRMSLNQTLKEFFDGKFEGSLLHE
jgi:putative transposase